MYKLSIDQLHSKYWHVVLQMSQLLRESDFSKIVLGRPVCLLAYRMPMGWDVLHWNGNGAILTTFSSQAGPKVVYFRCSQWQKCRQNDSSFSGYTLIISIFDIRFSAGNVMQYLPWLKYPCPRPPVPVNRCSWPGTGSPPWPAPTEGIMSHVPPHDDEEAAGPLMPIQRDC